MDEYETPLIPRVRSSIGTLHQHSVSISDGGGEGYARVQSHRHDERLITVVQSLYFLKSDAILMRSDRPYFHTIST